MFVRKFSFLLLGSFLAHSNAGATHEMKTVNWELINEKLPMPLSDMSATYDEATGLIFLVGGCDDPQGNSQLTPDLFICNSITEKGYSFNPIDGEFKELPPAPRARYRHTASNVEGKIWLVGGRTLEDLVIPEVDVSAHELTLHCKLLLLYQSHLSISHFFTFHELFNLTLHIDLRSCRKLLVHIWNPSSRLAILRPGIFL